MSIRVMTAEVDLVTVDVATGSGRVRAPAESNDEEADMSTTTNTAQAAREEPGRSSRAISLDPPTQAMSRRAWSSTR